MLSFLLSYAVATEASLPEPAEMSAAEVGAEDSPKRVSAPVFPSFLFFL